MVDLIIRLLQGEATELEARKIEQWRSASPEHERDYAEILQVWTLAGDTVTPDAPPPPTARDIIARAEARRAKDRGRLRRRALVRSPLVGYGLAAAATLAAVLVGLRESASRGADPTLTVVQSFTGAGNVTTLSLSDGSVLRLAPGSHVDFPPGVGRREISLEGRAYFAVAHGGSPFVVRTRTGMVTVLGTRFEVRVDEDGVLRLVVVEGTVRLEGEGGMVEVAAGQVAFLDPESAPRIVNRAEVWSLLDWPGGILLFQATPLDEVARELGRHFGRRVIVADDSLAAVRVTAWFQDETLEEVVSSLCLIAGARCEVTATHVRIER